MLRRSLLLASALGLLAPQALADAWNPGEAAQSFAPGLADATEALPREGNGARLIMVGHAFAQAFKLTLLDAVDLTVAVELENGSTVYGIYDSGLRTVIAVIEVDVTGKFVGGGFASEEEQQHPDFLWDPTGKGKQGSKIRLGRIPTARVRALIGALNNALDAGTCTVCGNIEN
jgi:hypothetical protein